MSLGRDLQPVVTPNGAPAGFRAAAAVLAVALNPVPGQGNGFWATKSPAMRQFRAHLREAGVSLVRARVC